jgi:hypothetical protein
LINFLLSPRAQSFIEEHCHDDPAQLLLKYKSVFDIPTSVIVDQIVGKKKAKDKLPSWYAEKKIIYPRRLHIEQASSEKAAKNKIELLKKELGADMHKKILVDLTGGFGIDSFFFSRHFRDVNFVEPDTLLLEIAKHNHNVLGASNIRYYNMTSEDFLRSSPINDRCDLIYVDPSRRRKGDQRVFSFDQCDPDVVTLQQEIWRAGNNLLIKSSPLLDIQKGLNELKCVKKVFIISIHGECKELLFYCEKSFQSEPHLVAINLNDEGSEFSFLTSEEREAEISYHDPLIYLYEPNSSLLKSGCFKLIGSRFKLFKLHPNTHLYTSESFIEDFPGRIFQITSYLKFDPKKILTSFEEGKANILTRNYPLRVEEIRKQTGLKDGGSKFLIGCTGMMTKKFLIVASRVK